MTPAARLAASIEALTEILSERRPADGVLSAYFRTRRYVGSKDRADIAGRVYAVLRHRARLGRLLARAGWKEVAALDPAAIARAWTFGHALVGEARTTDQLEALLTGDTYGPAALTDDERVLFDRLARDGAYADPSLPLEVRTECPDWAWPSLNALFGDRAEAELAALTEEAPFDLRVNEVKAERPAVAAALRADGLTVTETPLSPLGLRVSGRPPLAGHRLFKAGAIEVQDEGSQLVTLLTDPRPGQQVADFCAGAGGKALGLAARMRGKGRVVACDVSEGRLARAKERIRRAGIDNIEPKLLDSERDRWVKRQKRKFDRVLIDAPCTGTGAWRRNPDSRWRPVDLAEVTALQARIVDRAARLVKPGGRLVYATCSLLPEENEAQIDRLLAADPGLRPVPVAEIWPDAVGTPPPADLAAAPALRLTPHRHGTDGFFVAVLERTADADTTHSGGREPGDGNQEPGTRNQEPGTRK